MSIKIKLKLNITLHISYIGIIPSEIELICRHGMTAEMWQKLRHVLLSQKITAKIQQNKVINHDFHLFRNFPLLHKSKSLIGYCVTFAAFNGQ